EKVIMKLKKEIKNGKFVEIMGNIEQVLRELADSYYFNHEQLEADELNYQANEVKALVLHMSQRTVWTVLKMQ
ncbi:unnamed protein product, partial [marine sediment metagenome]